ncbi:hypothetical protein V1264_024909 [Littorina saxatilis]|uniref:Uncharacterized protein n=1 Tax=Littorina saxatilis TaxID=31220 RepID=A0AAN9AM13_9CAEN
MNLCDYLLACVLLFVTVGGFVGADDMTGPDAKDDVDLAGEDDTVDVDLAGADAKDDVDLAGANDKDDLDLPRADDKDDVELAGANDSDDVDLAAADVTDDVELAGADEKVDQDFDAELTMIYSLQATMDKVLENAGGKKNCSFQCPNGKFHW